MRRTTVHEQENHAFGARGKMRRVWFERAWRRSDGAREQIRKCKRAKSDGALTERLTAGHRIWKAVRHVR
jgi:hypothetical protein